MHDSYWWIVSPGPDPSHTYRQPAVSPGTGPANAEHANDQVFWLRYAPAAYKLSFLLMAIHRHFSSSNSGSSELDDSDFVGSQGNDTFTPSQCHRAVSCYSVHSEVVVCLAKLCLCHER